MQLRNVLTHLPLHQMVWVIKIKKQRRGPTSHLIA